MAGFSQQHQLGIDRLQPHATQSLGTDLMNLFGTASKGVETYNTIGVQAAKLEFNDMYRTALREQDALREESLKLKDDDVEGNLWITNKSREIQDRFTNKLADFSDHTEAYNAFAEASSSAIHQFQDYHNSFLQSAQKATKINTYNQVDDNSTLGLKATKDVFDTNVSQLKIVSDTEQKGFEDAQKLLFGHAWSNISDNANSVSKFDAVTELLDKHEGGVSYTSHDKVAEFMNMRILQNSDTAKLVVKTDANRVKTFGVDGLFSDEQNSKIVQLADQYISMMTNPKEGQDYWIGLKELKDTVGSIKTENLAQMEAGTSSVAWGRVNELTNKYLSTPEGQSLAKDPNKLFEFHSMLSDISKSASRKDAMIRIAENPNTLLKLKAGDGEMYSYITAKGFKDGVNSCSDEAYSNGQCDKLALKQGDLSSITSYLQGELNIARNTNPARANQLERVLSQVNDTKSPAKSVATNILMGKVTFKTKNEAENQLTILDSNQAELTADEYNKARTMLSETIAMFDKDGNITPDTIRSVNLSAKQNKIDDIHQLKKNDVNTEINKVFFGNNKASSKVTDFMYDKLLRERKFDPRVDSPASIAQLIKSHTILVDLDGQTNIRIPALGTLDEKSATNGINNFLKRMGKDRKYGIKFDSDNVNIFPSEDGQGYVVNWRNPKGQWQERGMKLTPDMVWEYSVSKKWNK